VSDYDNLTLFNEISSNVNLQASADFPEDWQQVDLL
jgi:hypothetical protein